MNLIDKKSTLARLREKFDRASSALLILSLVCLTVVITLFFTGKVGTRLLGVGVAITTVLFLAAFVRPFIAMAFDGYEAVFSVCATGASLFVAFITALYACYLLIVGGFNGPLSKILDLPPLFVALWAAATGWYVHFQLTRRSHRTTHAVTIVLGTRTNAEFQSKNALVRRYLPKKENFEALDESILAPESMAHALANYKKDIPESVSNLRLCKAVEAIKFLLNYYEFMAVGIKLGDIDERIIYETISPNVVKVFDDSEKLIKWLRDPEKGKQPLAFEHLEELVKKWRQVLKQDEANACKA